MPAHKTSLRNNRLAFMVSVLGVVLVVAGLVGYNLWRLRAAAIESQLEAAAQHAGAFEEHLTQTLSVIELNLVSLAEQDALDAAVQTLLRNARYLRSVSVVGSKGLITASSEPRNVGLPFDGTGFLPATAAATPLLRVGPLMGGRDFFNAQPTALDQPAPAQSFIAVQRDVLLPSGVFATLVAVVNPDYFLNYYERNVDVAQVEVELLRADGSLLLSTAQSYFPGTMTDATVIALLAKAESGRIQQREVGSKQHLTGYRASRFFPVVVVVHMDTDKVLVVWRREAMTTALVALVMLGLALSVSLLFFGRFQRMAADRAAWFHALDTQKYALDQHAIVSRTDAQGTITYANDRFCSISGYAREELLGQNHRLIKSAHHPTAFFADLWDTIAKGEVWHGEVCNLRKTGELYWVNATIVPLLGPDGFVQEYVAIRTDITDRKRTETSLEVARVAAEDANVAKSQFLANMSHEIRTPMNAILGMLQLLQRTPLNPEQADYAEKTEGAARSLLGLLNDILDFSKVEAGKMALDVGPFSVAGLMRDVGVILNSSVGTKPVRLALDVAADVPPVLLGDDMRLRQVLLNLGGNAIKFTEQGVVSVQLRMVAGLPPDLDGRVEFSVRDTGIGIAPEHMAHIFDGFSQAEASTTRRFGGTGLGLAICQRLVRMMGGELQLSTTPGQGSCFYFSVHLPAVAVPAVPAAAAVATLATPTGSAPVVAAPKVQRLSGMRLLVVEDNKINQMVAKGLLGQEGALITLADNGALGVQAVANAQPAFDAVLMDLQMPVMDGFEATRAIRHDLGIAHLPIIAISANAMASDRQACLAAGMNEHVGKPFELNHLVDLLQRFVHPTKVAPVALATAPVAPVPVLQQYPSGDLDIDGALARVGGDHAIYASVLEAFALEIAHVPPLTTRAMHTLKGLAATVGARHLSSVAAQLEQALKAGVPDTETEHTHMAAQLQSAVDALLVNLLPLVQRYKAANAQAAAGAQGPLNKAQLQRDLQALCMLLEESNMRALDAHTQVQKLYAAHLGADLQPLHDAMGVFDFATAREVCLKLSTRWLA